MAIDAIRAVESMEEIRFASYPHIKTQERKKIAKNLSNTFRQIVSQSSGKSSTFKEVIGNLKRGFMNG